MAFSDSESQRIVDIAKSATSGVERWHSGWHLKKEIQLTHLISTVTLALSAVWWVSKLEQRIAIAEARVQQQETFVREKQAEQDRNLRELAATIRQDVATLGAKIDRLIEREASRK
jgi:hypothetical protein